MRYPGSALGGRKAEAEGDEHRSGHSLQRLANAGTAENVSRFRDGDPTDVQPGERITTAETAMNDNRLVDTELIDQA